MPTFDFSNIINKLVSATLSVVANPVVILTAFAAALSGAVGIYVSYFADLSLPSLPNISLDFSGDMNSLWADLAGYILAYDTLREIFNFVIRFFAGLIPAIITFIASLFTAFWAYKVANAIRASVQDFGG